MKKTNRILSIVLAFCMLAGTIGALPISVSAADYTISQAYFAEKGTLGITEDMLLWSDVEADTYYVELYKEGETERMEEWEGTANNLAAASIIPYSGSYYFIVFAYKGNSIQASKTSDVFTYTDKTPPVASWYLYDGVQRSSDSEATVQFDNLDHHSACTYYYAVVDSGAAAPTIDTGGTGIAANAGSYNYINLTGLTAGAKDIYLILKDQDGNACEPIMTTIPAYEASESEQTYTLRIHTTVDGYGYGTDEGGSVTGAGTYKAGEKVTLVATLNDGYCTVGYAAHLDDGTRLYDIDLPLATERSFTVSFAMPAYDFDITASFYDHRYSAEDLGDGTHLSACFFCDLTSGTAEPHADEDGDGYCDACNHNPRWTVYEADESKHIIYCYMCEKTEGEPAPHTDADGDEVCDDCRHDLHIHTQGEWQSDDEAHWYLCTACGNEYAGYAEHDYSELKYENDKHFRGCVCGKYLPTTVESHTFTGEWQTSEMWHWQLCECGAPGNLAEHTSSGAATEDAAEVCTVCGYEISPKLTHIHKYGPVNYDAASHWFECSCGAKSSEFAHIYEFECTAKCSTCDYERLATHVYEGTALDDVRHELRCKYCDIRYQNSNLSNAFNHEYDDDCDSVCDICGYERTDAHNYEWIKDAEGHEEKCSVCGDVMVAKTAHTSSGAATDDTPETCTVCGYEIAPKLESTLTIVYNNTTIGGELAYHPGRAIYKFPTGTVVDLSDYWPEKREYTVDGCRYYFSNFIPSETGGVGLTSIVLKGDTTIYANWVIDTSKWVITFDATGGSIVPKKIIDYTFSGMDFYQPTRLGYEFLGWSLENDGTPDDLRGSRLTSDCTLYATWKQIHNISPNWSYDEEVHYRTCDCGERHDESEHKYYITSPICYKCGYVQGMAIGSTDKTSVEFVPVAGTTLPEGSYLDVKAYEVVEQDVETILKATVTDGVSDVTEIVPPKFYIIGHDGWVFSDQYTLRSGDKVTIDGITYIVASYTDNTACLYSNGEEYFLEKGKGLYKTGRRLDSYTTNTELISIDGVQYVITSRITFGNTETVYFATMDGRSAGHYSYDRGVIQDAYFFPDCTPEALTPKVSVGGVVAVADGQFLVNTASGVKIANTIWANDVSLHGANGLPVTGVSGTLTVSGIQYATTKSTVAAHIGAQEVDVGRFDDSVFDIRDVDDFSPFVLLDVADFSGTVIELTGVTLVENPDPDGPSTGAIVAIVIACVVVLAGGGFALYWFVSKKKKA